VDLSRRLEPFHVLAVLGLALGTLALYAPTLGHGYVFDDGAAVVENPVVASGTLHDVFSYDYWGSRRGHRHVTTYRPLTTLTFRVERALAGLEPAVSHAVNLALHVAAVLLVYALVLALRGPRALALAAAALFAVHPVHVEAVVGVVNRAELLAFVLGVGSLLAWVRGLRGLALAAFAGALLAKENAVTVLPLVAAADWLGGTGTPLPLRWQARARRLALRLAPFAALVVAMLLLRSRVLPAVLGGAIPPADNPMVDAGWPSRALTPLKTWAFALRQGLVPARLSPDWSANALPPAGWADPWAWAGLGALVLGAVAAWGLRRRAPAVSLGLVAFALTWSVSSNVPFLSTIVYADRALYLPSLGLSVALAGVAFDVARSLPRGWPAWAAWGLYLALLAAQTVGYGRAWETDRTLFEHAVQAAPQSARAHANLGAALGDVGELAASEAHLRTALRLDPYDVQTRANLGGQLLTQGRLDEAERQLLEAVALDGGLADAWVNLAQLRLRQGSPADALPAALKATALAPAEPVAWENLGAARLGTGDLAGGVDALLTALHKGARDPEGIRANLERLGRQTGTWEQIRAKLGSGSIR
jgi:Flp pilus assembly protein TadD